MSDRPYWQKDPIKRVIMVGVDGEPINFPGGSEGPFETELVVGGDSVGPENPLPVQLSGSSVAESKTESDAIANVVTFADAVTSIEIYHSETDAQEFVVNGLTLTVAAGGWRSPVAGTPSAEVTLPNGVTGVIVNRLV